MIRVIFSIALALSMPNIPLTSVGDTQIKQNLATARKDELVWRYKIINGLLYKRLWNVTQNKWQNDNWILC
ncbi:MAG: hypothetical protein Q4C49_01910 [Bacillota bacterium]|nr:hypothetical protein [Bacillota bacterium]